MRSKIKLVQYLFPIFLIFLICGLCGGMLYDLGHKIPNWLKIIMGIILLFYPIFNMVSILSIPTIELKGDTISSTSFFKHQEMTFADIIEINEFNNRNKIYKIGKFYTIYSRKGEQIDIPYGVYRNELAILSFIKNHLNK